MRILNTGLVKYPAYRRRTRTLALRCDACVDADVCGTRTLALRCDACVDADVCGTQYPP
jgi:hypothetical protein